MHLCQSTHNFKWLFTKFTCVIVVLFAQNVVFIIHILEQDNGLSNYQPVGCMRLTRG